MTSGDEKFETATAQPAAVFARLTVMKKRADFVAASKAHYQTSPSLTVQMRNRDDDDPAVRIGFTCSKKVGNAVARNRAKRRLREIARLDLPALAKAGHDYVLIGKKEVTATREFEAMRADFAKAIGKLS
ncbi:ribonuclease P protein component [Octadecabacter temperatus]|uniref:Ribonuclease P protein component n=1 Tax=Octadecabacter temperatus TaxID=1458307 RepID=A0A0K0Y1T7_9RHOB|nr:ribonuclease P protein component [Octadecabacter temperatus]AKS44895.1 ribonuclease P [Octadecabacter temperatus]SIO33959.1 ribonuclease P protein component [Octadecabacter temperatus]